MKYADLFIEHDDFYSQKAENYLFAYQEILEKYIKKKKPVNLLEIGVQNGGSLQIWKKFLPEGSQIYGVDLNPSCKEINFEKNIHFELGNAASSDFWTNKLQDVTFDIIIDDGSHMCIDVTNSFEFLFPLKLNMGGTYIVEGLDASYKKDYYGGYKKKGSSIEYLKNLIDYLNFNYIELPPDFDKESLGPLSDLNKQIKRVSFYDGICAIEKYNKRLKSTFKTILAGENANVKAYADAESLKAKNNLDSIKTCKKYFE